MAEKVLIDIRGEEEYVAGHIPGARHCLLQELSFVLSDVDHADPVVLVCRTGKRAVQVKALLEEEGFQHVEVLTGGMTAYRGELVEGEE